MRPKANWQGSEVAVVKGGINGTVHCKGVGLVRYGAELEARIGQLLASDPEAALKECEEENAGLAALVGYFQAVAGGLTDACK